MTARSLSLNFGESARDCRLGGLRAPVFPGDFGSVRRKLKADRLVALVYMPTLTDADAANEPASEPFLVTFVCA